MRTHAMMNESKALRTNRMPSEEERADGLATD